jgi:hypothetical protein
MGTGPRGDLHAAGSRGDFITCAFEGGTALKAPSVALREFTGDGRVVAERFFEPGYAACHGVAADEAGSFLYALANGSGEKLVILGDGFGTLTTPERAFRMLDEPAAGIAVGAIQRGSAFVSSPNRFGVVEVGVTSGRSIRRFRVDGFDPDTATPAIAAWPYEDGTLAIAGYAGGLVVVVVGEDGGERLRTEPLLFSLAEDVPPALVSTPHGLVVAQLAFGESDPSRGLLEVVQIGPDGGLVLMPMAFPTARHVDLSIAAGVRGAFVNGSVLLHWSGVDRGAGVELPMTSLLTMSCP